MKLKVIGDKVILEKIKLEEKNPSSILLLESSEKPEPTAKVVGVGKGRILENGELIKPTVKVGDIVIYNGAGTPVTFEDKKYLIIAEQGIVAIIED